MSKKVKTDIVNQLLARKDVEIMDLYEETRELFEEKLRKQVSEEDILQFAYGLLYDLYQQKMKPQKSIQLFEQGGNAVLTAASQSKVSPREVLMSLDEAELREMLEEEGTDIGDTSSVIIG